MFFFCTDGRHVSFEILLHCINSPGNKRKTGNKFFFFFFTAISAQRECSTRPLPLLWWMTAQISFLWLSRFTVHYITLFLSWAHKKFCFCKQVIKRIEHIFLFFFSSTLHVIFEWGSGVINCFTWGSYFVLLCHLMQSLHHISLLAQQLHSNFLPVKLSFPCSFGCLLSIKSLFCFVIKEMMRWG